MKETMKRGFTLIELLVVIAIIALLAAVVLTSLASARKKGADSAITQNIRGMATQAQLYYNDNGSTYTGLCNDSHVQQAVSAVANAGGSMTCTDTVNSGADYLMYSALVSNGSETYCVDSTGVATTTTAAVPDATTGLCLSTSI